MRNKECTKCYQIKDATKDFYICKGKIRGECKKCTVRRNVKYQQNVRSWQDKCQDEDSRRAYMRSYYAKNKEKFAKYREVFREKYPDYYREYTRKKKEDEDDIPHPSLIDSPKPMNKRPGL